MEMTAPTLMQQVDRSVDIETTWEDHWSTWSRVQKVAEREFGVPVGLRPVEIVPRNPHAPMERTWVWRWRWTGVEPVTP